MGTNHDPYLAELREHATETRLLLSNPRRADRERMVVRAYLRCLGIPFADDEIVASTEEPVDVQFRAARFQIREILGDRKRGKDWADREDRYHAAKMVSDVAEAFTKSIAVPYDEAVEMVTKALAEKVMHYAPASSARLDVLIYIDLKNSHLWPTKPRDVIDSLSELDQQGWRSASMLFLPYGVVLTARPNAPDFLRSKIGRVLNEWPGPDGWFEP